MTFYCHDIAMEYDGQCDYSIGELADEAGVSTRTIRYYVSEGLLPPPVGAGPHSRYTDAHRQQLEIIGRLKAQYLPLKEIRRRLIGHGAHPMAAPASDAAPEEPEHGRFRGLSRRSREIAKERGHRLNFAAADMASPMLSEPIQAAVNYSMPPPSDYRERDQPWRRVAISEEAELLITEDQYRRHQDKIDWLIQWAQKVLKP
jgi:DNA-binding transcriptional MerR regulator